MGETDSSLNWKHYNIYIQKRKDFRQLTELIIVEKDILEELASRIEKPDPNITR